MRRLGNPARTQFRPAFFGSYQAGQRQLFEPLSVGFACPGLATPRLTFAFSCPTGAPGDQQNFIRLNAELARNWPPITKTKAPLAEADQFKDVKDKLSLLER